MCARTGKVTLPYGAFASRPITSIQSVQNMLRHEPKIVARYAKHFHAKPADVRSFLSNLRVSTVRKPTVASVYYVVGGEKILSHKKRLSAGTQMLVDRNGKPILLMPCGNPLTSSVTQPKVAQRPKPKPKVAVASTVQETPMPPVVPAPAPVIPENPVVAVLSEPPAELTPTVEAPPVVTSIPALVSHTNWALAGLGAIGAVSLTKTSRSAPVPEPSTLVTFGVVGSAFVGSVLGRRRRRN